MSLRKRKPQECPKCKQSEFLQEDDDKETLFCFECGVGVRKKKRQGRSKESRERVKSLPCWEKHDMRCRGCNQVCFVEDHSSGDLICEVCGVVYSGGALFFNVNTFPMKNPSKPYARVVHWQQRITQLLGNDPEVDPSAMEKLRVSLQHEENWKTFGKKSFAKKCRELNLDPKIACHWVQLRVNLGWELQLDVFSEELLLRCKARYICLEKAFQSELHVPHGEKRSSKLQRTNIVSLNFSIPMIFRLEDENVFKVVAKYFPQQSNAGHPEINNERWRVLMNYCQKHYQHMEMPVKEQTFHFDWPFLPMTYADVIGYFSHFF